MRTRVSLAIALVVLTAALCRAAESGDAATQIRVGGTYRTAVTLERSTCRTPPTIERHDTIVRHSAGAEKLSLSHAGNSYRGLLAADGTFATEPLELSGGNSRYTITIRGAFTADALDALVTVDQSGRDACTYVVRWAGPKKGKPNVVP